MISLLISMCALLLGYIFYGRFIERIFSPDKDRITPAIGKADGVDYIKLPGWKVFMIQFLNIAGTGPIFGAIMGAKFGTASYLWIVLGCIFAGAVHDYLSGMISLRDGGDSLPDIVGKYAGKNSMRIMLVLSMFMLILVGAVFVYSPAIILGNLCGGSRTALLIWVAAIFGYYILATLMPIDKIIGKIYPVFAFSLLFMAVALLVCLLVKWPSIPEIWDGLGNRGPSVGVKGQSIFPYLFITIACGAISGFHATQSPMMARCMENEKLGRPIFYGSMITEGFVALIWATVSSYFFFDGGAAELGSSIKVSAPEVVTLVSKQWLGVFGGLLALLGVVAAPITSGDTALRSARLIISDVLKLDQKTIGQRLSISIPIFIVTGLILWFNIADEDGFNKIWQYFGWTNQTLAAFTLWVITGFLVKRRKGCVYLVSMIPACVMTSVCFTFIAVNKIGFNLPESLIPWLGIAGGVIPVILFIIWKRNRHESIN